MTNSFSMALAAAWLSSVTSTFLCSTETLSTEVEAKFIDEVSANKVTNKYWTGLFEIIIIKTVSKFRFQKFFAKVHF